MKTPCPQCHETTELTFPVDWKDFACSHCHTYFKKNEAGNLQETKRFPESTEPFPFYIGQQGVLEGVLWEVGGITIKYVVNEPYGWREYTLYSASGETCFLSEYDGHWVLAREIETGETFSFQANHGRNYKGEFYPIFNNTTYQTEYAAGFFDHPVPMEGKAKDFVRPPYALLLEKEGKETYAFEARHLPEAELLKAFPGVVLPPRSGQGMLEPFYADVPVLGWILATVGGFILLCQLLLSGFFPSYRVLDEYVMMPDTVAGVTHVSPSFACTGLRAPLLVELSAPVNNSWAGVDFCLVNEDTKEERYASVEVAYYWGTDQGESWTEGSTNPSVKICGVPPGRYHFVLQVSKQPDRPELNALHYSVTARASTAINVLWALGLLAVAAAAAFLWQSHFEKQRWMNSDFPPEVEEEY